MPKKNMTPAERKAWGAKMRAAREAKKEEVHPSPAHEPTVAELMAQLNELKSKLDFSQPAQQQITSQGFVGTTEKYKVDPKYYPDPRDRIAKEDRLEREAFRHNYELEWDVKVSQYETQDGRRFREPKFELNLVGIQKDDQGNDTGKRFYVRKSVYHEDPDAALVIARENGIPVDESREKEFLDEMRYLRFRDWVFDYFWPKPATQPKGTREEVIGNRLVPVFEKSDQEVSFDSEITKNV